MSGWRDHILRAFAPGAARLTLVADPDDLLLDENILQEIRARGFELIPFEDSVAFRYVYESRFRSWWDRGEETELVVVLRLPSGQLESLPYDLLQAGRQLSFSLSDLFPSLSYPVVSALDRADLDKLYAAQEEYRPEPLGENATKDFVLRHVFDIVPEHIRKPEDLLRVLLRLHYRQQRIPEILVEYLNRLLLQNPCFKDWPLEIIVSDSEAFFSFLQERWPVFLDWLIQPQEFAAIREVQERYGLKFSGPALLPFNHEDVRVYVDNLFLDGKLQPVSHSQADQVIQINPWVICGILRSEKESRQQRIKKLLDTLEKETVLTTAEVRHEAWAYFAYRWAELWALLRDPDAFLDDIYREHVEKLQARVDACFLTWVQQRYPSLINLPPTVPTMLHHIPRYFARELEGRQDVKIAFLVIDGLALDQWIVVRQELKRQDKNLQFGEKTVFAWIPTITPVCRQAAFAGRPPFFFPKSIHTTDREASLWTQFWTTWGLSQDEVGYCRGLGDNLGERVEEMLNQPRLRVAGLVIDKVDRIMHGMELGAAGMHNQVRQWVREGFLKELLDLLNAHGFQVYLTSDHGNVEAVGMGKPQEGAVADVRGERVRVYKDPASRARVKKQFPGALEWPPIGLPEDYLPLIAPERMAFVQKGKILVTHGGISLEELIVPFVRVERR